MHQLEELARYDVCSGVLLGQPRRSVRLLKEQRYPTLELRFLTEKVRPAHAFCFNPLLASFCQADSCKPRKIGAVRTPRRVTSSMP